MHKERTQERERKRMRKKKKAFGIHWLIKLANSKTFMEEREEHKTRRDNYVQTVTGRGVEQRGTQSQGHEWRQKLRRCVQAGVHGESS